MLRLERPSYPPEIHWDSMSWSWRWDCTLIGCHEGGTGYESRDEARVVGLAHSDVHGGGSW